LPFDKSGDWFYHFVELLSLVLVCASIYGVFATFLPTYDERHDKFGDLYIPSEYGILYILIPCIILAFLFHPSLNKELMSDTCWTLSMYLEAVAMLPQIYMFSRQATTDGTSVDPMIGHTIFAVGFSRIFEFLFWMGSFSELSDHAGSKVPGYVVLISQIVHLILMGDTFYYYMKSVSAGVPMQLPSNSNYQHFGLDV
jgi:ER lumen protein retaining receptor